MNEARLYLSDGPLELQLDPAHGGAIAAFRHAGFALMRETPPGTSDARLFSSYPLVPFSNRIAAGRFTFAGRSYELERDAITGRAHAIHGEGWRRAWNITGQTRTSAHLVLEHDGHAPGCWPFPFRAEQEFVISGNELTVSLALTNTGAASAPAGIGMHPYFPRHGAVSLGFHAEAVWRNGPDHLPSEPMPLPDAWNFSSPELLGEPGLDNCFAGWSGSAEIAWPARGLALRITADPCFGHAIVYTPSGADHFAFEPVSHMNDAINRTATPGHGLVVLEPGGSFRGSVRFAIAMSG